jgi:hypothetical protein
VLALLLQRGAAINRRIARLWRAAGLDVIVTEDPDDVGKHVQNVAFIGADEFDRNVVAAALRANPALRAVIWTAESVARLLRFVVEHPRLISILGRPSFETTPEPWELTMVARRMINPHEAPPAVHRFISYGGSGFDQLVASTAAMEAATTRAQAFVDRLTVPKWICELVGELVHELLMNALYDAPVDAQGRPRFTHARKTPIELATHEAARLRICTDGLRLCIQVSDPFGRLLRKHVFEGLGRGLREGELDTTAGGAGLGMAVVHNACVSLVYDVVPEKHTDVTAFLDLELSRREFRSRARSIHFFERHP